MVYNLFPFARMRTRVKICGITRPEDALAAVRCGADAIGLVFHPASPRFVRLDVARAVAMVVPAYVTIVGLFVDAAVAEIERALEQVPLNLLQFHGQETNESCRRYGVPFTKAVRMAKGVDVSSTLLAYPDARGFLLDTFVAGIAGGTGQVFDWNVIPQNLSAPIILAGGLTAQNVGNAVLRVRPYAVDVSGGVEAAKGIKDAKRIEEFILAVQTADEVVVGLSS